MLKLAPLLSELKIKTKDLGIINLDVEHGDFAWSQGPYIEEIETQYNAGKPVRIIVLKARQLGISTATEGVLFWWNFLHPGSNNLVIAHENVPSAELFEMTKHYYDTWPYKNIFPTRYHTRQQLRWEETRSQMRVASAKNTGVGRASTLHGLHASEVAFWPQPRELFTGLNQTIPNKHGTIIVLESTANGVGNWFHEAWIAAETGESDYTPLFFPWWRHPEYMMAHTLKLNDLDNYEKTLLRFGATMEHIAWRRWAIINKADGDIDMFMQEYPATPEEAFVMSGRPIFSHNKLDICFKRERGYRGFLIDDPVTRNGVRFEHDPGGNLTVFRAPALGDSRSDRYFVSGDPSESIAGDPACAQVINRGTFEQVAVWHGRTDPMEFGRELMRIGRFYNNCTVCPEVEGGGQATIAIIINASYPRIWAHRQADKVPGRFSMNTLGWSTNWQRKSWCIGTLKHLVVTNSITLHDFKTYAQMRSYVEHDNGEWGNADKETHDDAVMALAIAVAASISDGPFVPDMPAHAIADIYNQEFELASV